MNALSLPWRFALRNWKLSPRSTFFHVDGLPRVAAVILIVGFVAVSTLSYFSTVKPSYLGLKFEPCGQESCVSWVMPASHAWDQGARIGMALISLDGEDVSTSPSALLKESPATAELLDPSGESVHINVANTVTPLGEGPLKFSLWILGLGFVVLGSLVLLRRPDVNAARLFAVFAASTAFGLAVGPVAGGTGLKWALISQGIVLLLIGASFISFIAALVLREMSRLWTLLLASFWISGAVILITYLNAVVVSPDSYEIVRPAIPLYLSASLLLGVGLLVRATLRPGSTTTQQQSRLCLWGIGAGALPFTVFTLIPESLGLGSLYPAHLTILLWGLIPALFAYAILQHQLLGIRRLIHRGMVYGIATFVTLAITSLALIGVIRLVGENQATEYSITVVPTILVLGVITFFPLRKAAKWMVNRYIYEDIIDYQTFVNLMRRDMLPSEIVREGANGSLTLLAKSFNLESGLLFLGPSPNKAELSASLGEGAEKTIKEILPHVEHFIQRSSQEDLVEIRWESDSLILAALKLPNRYLGYILLGPKLDGEVFLAEERRLIAAVAPLITLTIDKATLSEDLRELNKRLSNVQETERAMIAGDLHDGPLQKAMLLAGGFVNGSVTQGDLAQEIVLELREISSRLRPSILDDLGIVAAIDWLLSDVARRTEIRTRLSLKNVEEDERFESGVEVALFRIIQEASSNVVKHASASRLEVMLERIDSSLRLEISDDGQGFLVENVGTSGFGLLNMRERVAQLGGLLDIVSSPGLGTKLTIRVPQTQPDPNGRS